MEEKLEIKLFNGHAVMLKLDENAEDYLYAIEDVISLITETESPEEYSSKIKEIKKEYGVNLSNVCCTFKMHDLNGDRENIDIADCLGFLRIVQSIPS